MSAYDLNNLLNFLPESLVDPETEVVPVCETVEPNPSGEIHESSSNQSFALEGVPIEACAENSHGAPFENFKKSSERNDLEGTINPHAAVYTYPYSSTSYVTEKRAKKVSKQGLIDSYDATLDLKSENICENSYDPTTRCKLASHAKEHVLFSSYPEISEELELCNIEICAPSTNIQRDIECLNISSTVTSSSDIFILDIASINLNEIQKEEFKDFDAAYWNENEISHSEMNFSEKSLIFVPGITCSSKVKDQATNLSDTSSTVGENGIVVRCEKDESDMTVSSGVTSLDSFKGLNTPEAVGGSPSETSELIICDIPIRKHIEALELTKYDGLVVERVEGPECAVTDLPAVGQRESNEMVCVGGPNHLITHQCCENTTSFFTQENMMYAKEQTTVKNCQQCDNLNVPTIVESKNVLSTRNIEICDGREGFLSDHKRIIEAECRTSFIDDPPNHEHSDFCNNLIDKVVIQASKHEKDFKHELLKDKKGKTNENNEGQKKTSSNPSILKRGDFEKSQIRYEPFNTRRNASDGENSTLVDCYAPVKGMNYRSEQTDDAIIEEEMQAHGQDSEFLKRNLDFRLGLNVSLDINNSVSSESLIRKKPIFCTDFVIDVPNTEEETSDIAWAYSSLAYPYKSCIEIRQINSFNCQNRLTEKNNSRDETAAVVGKSIKLPRIRNKSTENLVTAQPEKQTKEILNYTYVLPKNKGTDSVSVSENKDNTSLNLTSLKSKLRRSSKFIKSDSKARKFYKKYSVDTAFKFNEGSETDDGFYDSSEGGSLRKFISNSDFPTEKSETIRSNEISSEYFMPTKGCDNLTPLEVSNSGARKQFSSEKGLSSFTSTSVRASFIGFCETMLETSSPTGTFGQSSPVSCERKSIRKTSSNDYSVDSGITGSESTASDSSPSPSRSFSPNQKAIKKSESAEAVYQLDKTLNDIEQGESSDATITESTTNLTDMKEEKSFSFKYSRPPMFEPPPPPPLSHSLGDLFELKMYSDILTDSNGYQIPRPKLIERHSHENVTEYFDNAHEENKLVEELSVQIPSIGKKCECISCEAQRSVQEYLKSCQLYDKKRFYSLPPPPKPARNSNDMPHVKRTESVVTINCGTIEENGVRLLKYFDYSKDEEARLLSGSVQVDEPQINGTPKSVRFSTFPSNPTKPRDRKKKNAERRKTCAISPSELKSLEIERPRPISIAFEGNTAIYRRDSQTSTARIEELTGASSCADEDTQLDFSTAVVQQPEDLDLPISMPAEGCSRHFVIVAIDFGTTFSGYAFAFVKDPSNIHLMRKWEGGDPGLSNNKTPTVLLLTPDEEFHSFGYTARDFYHDLEPRDAKRWLYFDKFKMTLHHEKVLTRETTVVATNGHTMPALTVFAHALRYFRDHAVREISDHSGTKLLDEDIRWVVTVPAIWRPQAKQFMREAAYQAGLSSPNHPDRILIALEPEAASIYCRQLKLNELVPDKPLIFHLTPQNGKALKPWQAKKESDVISLCSLPAKENEVGVRYMVVDCGGGTVDITVHQLASESGLLKELHRATGGPNGAVGVDTSFEKLLGRIFGEDFLGHFKMRRPASYVDLLIAFEARKRSASPFKCTPLNISLPFSFIDAFRKYRGKEVEAAIQKHNDPHIRWSSQGMLRLDQEAMRRLFEPTLTSIIEHIDSVLRDPSCEGISNLFLVGGFAESALLQHKVREVFNDRLRVVIPQYASLVTLRGAVYFGLNPGIVAIRRSRLTIGVGVLNKYIPGIHPVEKLIKRDNQSWCSDVFDKFVIADQSVALGDRVVRSYTPAAANQQVVVLNVYCSDSDEQKYITEPNVRRLATMRMELTQGKHSGKRARELQVALEFGDTEVKASAIEVSTGKSVNVRMDFLQSDI
ncbi:uncharacterized protein LOC136027422 [Artemia franciscana]